MKPTVATHGIRGYASVFGVKDSKNSVVDKGAFSRSIALGPRPQFGRQHALLLDPFGTAMPAGVITKLEEDRLGLRFEARCHDTPLGRELLTCVSDGSMRGVSFGFDLETAEGHDVNGVLHLTRLDLLEIGPVAYPSNRQATCEVHELPQTSAPPAPAADATEEQQLHALLTWAAKEIRR